MTVGGCSVGPDYHEPTPDVPVSWQAERINPALTTLATKPLPNWWLRFNDAPLNALMDKALAGNLDIKIALTRIDQARAERRGTQAELFPTVNIKAGAQRQENPLPALAPGLRYNMFELGFDALWEIDLFGRQQRRLEAALAELDGAHADYRQALVTLRAELARAYVEYRSTQNQLRITTSNLQTQQDTLSLTEKLFNEGVVDGASRCVSGDSIYNFCRAWPAGCTDSRVTGLVYFGYVAASVCRHLVTDLSRHAGPLDAAARAIDADHPVAFANAVRRHDAPRKHAGASAKHHAGSTDDAFRVTGAGYFVSWGRI